jgi:hypothetical protein
MARRLLTILAAAIVGAIFAAGLFIRGPVGGGLLLLTDAVLIALARLTWSRLRPQGRPLRLVVIVAIAVIAVIKLAS